jgi:single-strand DNA-binding protein
MNKVILIGRVGKDPEVKSFSNGGQVCTLTLATSEKYKDKQGNKQESTEWHTCKFSDKQAEIVAQYVKKGDQLAVTGKIHYRIVEDAGQKRYYTEVLCREFEFIGGKPHGGNTQSHAAEYTPPSAKTDDSNDLIF